VRPRGKNGKNLKVGLIGSSIQIPRRHSQCSEVPETKEGRGKEEKGKEDKMGNE